MKMSSISLALCFMGSLALLIQTSHAQNSPKDYLNAHNSARAAAYAPNIIWNDTVAAYAQNYSNSRTADCNLVHSGGPYGENLTKGSGTFTGTAAVSLKVAEKANYNYSTNTCAAGKVCGHYTQVVWRNSIGIGCARVQCSNGWWFVSCNYDPPGNYVGQKPY